MPSMIFEYSQPSLTTLSSFDSFDGDDNDLISTDDASSSTSSSCCSSEEQEEQADDDDDFDLQLIGPLSNGFQLDCWDHHAPSTSPTSTTLLSVDENGIHSFQLPLHLKNHSHDYYDYKKTMNNNANQHQGNSQSNKLSLSPVVSCLMKDLSARHNNNDNNNDSHTSFKKKKHVHFGEGNQYYVYDKPAMEDFFRLYYSAHELQRIRDQLRIDYNNNKSNKLHLPEEEPTEIDYAEDFPVW